MADKTIGDLTPAPGSINDINTLFVVQQNGAAYNVNGAAFISALSVIREAHGGIVSVLKTSSSGTDPVVDVYTITFADTTTATFNVTNGAKGDTGDSCYVHIKYASVQPTRDSDMTDIPSAWMGIYSGTSATAPTSYTAYAWNNIKGATGSTGAAASLQTSEVKYQASSSGTVVPTGEWTVSVPTVEAGEFLWTRTVLTFNSGSPVVFYAVGYQGSNGSGSGTVTAVNEQQPSGSGNVILTATNIPTSDNSNVQAKLTSLASDVTGLNTAVQGKASQSALDALTTTVNGKAATSDVILKDGTTIVVWSSSSNDLNDLYTGVVLCNENVHNTPSAAWWLIIGAGQADTRTQTAYALFNNVTPKIRYKANNTWGSWADIKYDKPKVGYVELSGSWSGSASPYSQTVTMYTASSGGTAITVSANAKIDLQPNASFYAAMVDAQTSAVYVENNNGTLTAYAIGAIPNTSAVRIQATYYEVG